MGWGAMDSGAVAQPTSKGTLLRKKEREREQTCTAKALHAPDNLILV